MTVTIGHVYISALFEQKLSNVQKSVFYVKIVSLIFCVMNIFLRYFNMTIIACSPKRCRVCVCSSVYICPERNELHHHVIVAGGRGHPERSYIDDNFIVEIAISLQTRLILTYYQKLTFASIFDP